MTTKVNLLTTLIVVLLATSFVYTGSLAAATIGPGAAIATNANDTAGGSRTNVDSLNGLLLPAGIYVVDDWEFLAGQSGSVTPFVATSGGVDNYNTIAVGETVVIPGAQPATTTNFGLSNTFILNSPTTVYAGINNPIGTGNPVRLFDGTGNTDHDGTPVDVTSINQTVTGFSNPNLTRTYAFGLNVGTRTEVRVGPDVTIPATTLDNPNGPRMNVDNTAIMTLGPGTYTASDFSFAAGQDGQVTPFLAILDGGNYEVIALGDTVTTPDQDIIATVPFGGSDTFTLLTTTDIYAGITNPAGFDNPIYLQVGGGLSTDHDGTPLALTGVGQLVPLSGFSNPNLNRQYAFSIGVVPEPSSFVLGLVVVMIGLAVYHVRRKRS